MKQTNLDLLTYIEKSIKHDNNPFVMNNFTKNQYILEQNKRNFDVFILKNGLAKCFLTVDTGNDFIQEFFSVGDLFGEIEVINNSVNFCAVTSLTDLTVYRITSNEFLKLMHTDSVFNNLIIKIMANKIHSKALRHSFNQTHAIELNYLRLIKEIPDLRRLISKLDIANYLGITLRSLNRVLVKIESKD